MSYLVKNIFNGSSTNETNAVSSVFHPYDGNAAGVMQSVGSSVKNVINPFNKVHDSVARMLLRVQTSVIQRDRREAIKELCLISPNNLAVCMSNEDITMLIRIAELNQEDVQIHVRVLEFLSHLTETEGTDIATNEDRSGILDHILEHHTAFMISSLQNAALTAETEETHSNHLFWLRYYCVKLLQRLQMHDGLRLPKLLIDLQAINYIIDLLKDVSNDGMLRNEGMLLLNALTMTDKELQTMLAFDDCFVTLFDIIDEEGGVEGGIIVIDCLTIISNMLKSNEATQKYFREMNYIVKLKPLLVDTTQTDGQLTQRGMDVVVFAISVIENLLWHAATSESEGQKVKDAIVRNGIIGSLCRVGLSHYLDDATSVAGLRTLAEITSGHRGTCEALLELKMTVLGAHNVPALWNLLYMVLYRVSIDQQTQCIQIIISMIRNTSTGAHTASLLVKNLIPLSHQYLHNIDKNDPKQLQGLHCGFLLSSGLFGTNPPTPTSRYCSAVLLNEILGIPQVAVGLLHLPWSNNSTFFTAYTSHVCDVIRQQMSDIHATCRMLRPLLTWFDLCGSSISMFLSNLTAFSFFLNWCASPPGKSPINIRFMCAVVCLKACQASRVIDLPPTVRVTPDELMSRFNETIGDCSALNDMRFNVGATQEWKHAPHELGNVRLSSVLVSTFDDVFKSQIDNILKIHSDSQNSEFDKPDSPNHMVYLDGSSSLSREELLEFVDLLSEKLNKKADECKCLKEEVKELKVQLSAVKGGNNVSITLKDDILVPNVEIYTDNDASTLQDRLYTALAERDELLIMVAEIDEERKQLETQISSIVTESLI